MARRAKNSDRPDANASGICDFARLPFVGTTLIIAYQIPSADHCLRTTTASADFAVLTYRNADCREGEPQGPGAHEVEAQMEDWSVPVCSRCAES